MYKKANRASLMAFVVLPHQQLIIGSATDRHAKYVRQCMGLGKRRLDKKQIYTLGYSIERAQFTPELGKISLRLDITHARTASNQASAKIYSKTDMLSASR